MKLAAQVLESALLQEPLWPSWLAQGRAMAVSLPHRVMSPSKPHRRPLPPTLVTEIWAQSRE